MNKTLAIEILRRNTQALKTNIKQALSEDPEGPEVVMYTMLDLVLNSMLAQCKGKCGKDHAEAALCVMSAVADILTDDEIGVMVAEATDRVEAELADVMADAHDATKH